jgi:hypothetical protein
MRKRIFTDLMTGKITPLICLKDKLLEREGTKKTKQREKKSRTTKSGRGKGP